MLLGPAIPNLDRAIDSRVELTYPPVSGRRIEIRAEREPRCRRPPTWVVTCVLWADGASVGSVAVLTRRAPLRASECRVFPTRRELYMRCHLFKEQGVGSVCVGVFCCYRQLEGQGGEGTFHGVMAWLVKMGFHFFFLGGGVDMFVGQFLVVDEMERKYIYRE